MDNRSAAHLAGQAGGTHAQSYVGADYGTAGYAAYFNSEQMGQFRSHPPDYFLYSQNQILANGEQQKSSYASYGVAPMAPPQGFLYDTMSIPTRPDGINSSTGRPCGRALKDSKLYTATKRRKPLAETGSVKRNRPSRVGSSLKNTLRIQKNQQPRSALDCCIEDCASETGSRVSECCSSCSEGLPCAEPDCGKQPDAVVPCTKQSCEEPLCFDPCFPSRRQQHFEWQQGIIPSSQRISTWDSSSWNPEAPRASSPTTMGNKIDPALLIAVASAPSRSISPDPSTPSMVQIAETPFATTSTLATPRFTGNSQIPYPDESAPAISGAGTMFDAGWMDKLNYGTFNCAWADCQLPFSNQKDWSYHLHQAHVDPQMMFDCPLQSDTCPPNITSHPLDHLQAAHGFNFDYNSYSCPAPACAPDNETFCNPAMLHKHFDQAHATPAAGSLYCQWNACNSVFTDQCQLLNHLDEDHKLGYSAKEESLSNRLAPPEIAHYPAVIPDEDLSEDETHSSCQWKLGSSICGVKCENPKELQDHITEHHLRALNKTTGYFCQWESCNRQKLGGKAGFSQRGKLVRHMQTHTILKEEVCDFPGCGRQFSAKQALLQHKRLHTGEKPFKCQHCDRAFAQQSACTMHERTHTGLKPLQCEHCGKRFSESSNLSKHRRMHQEEKEKKGYKCDFPGCDKTFVRFASLKNHKREAHAGVDHASKASSSVYSEEGEMEESDEPIASRRGSSSKVTGQSS